MTATMIERDHPEQEECTECGSELDFDHFIVTAPDGPLCRGCANDSVPGLGDAAHGLSLLKWALIYDITQSRRLEVQQPLNRLAMYADDLRTGKTVVGICGTDGTIQPLRPGGDDPHDTIRRHTMRVVGSNR